MSTSGELSNQGGRQRHAPFSIIDRNSDFLYSDRMKGQMLATFRSFSLSFLGRMVSIVCVTLVLSYIFFEVLDLDGSNFRTHRDPVQITAIVQEVETDVDSFPARTPGKALDRGLVLPAGKARPMGSSLLYRRICTAYLLSTAPLRLSNRAAAFFHTRRLPIERLGSTLSYLFGASATP